MKKIGSALALMTFLAIASASSAEVALHGDLNNRFMIYTNHADFLKYNQGTAKLDDGNVSASWGEIKYRLWGDFSSAEGAIKGVYAAEIGGVRFGRTGSLGKGVGGGFSGDAVNIETRWAYTEFQIPGIERKARTQIGLMPYSVNRYLWKETAMGVNFNGDHNWGDYQLSWMRTNEHFPTDADDNADDLDNFVGRINFKPGNGLKGGVFALLSHGDAGESDPANFGTITSPQYEIKKFANGVNIDLFSIGIDGSYSIPVGSDKMFFNWDAIYQTGNIDNAIFENALTGESVTGDFDVSSYFAHADVGYRHEDLTFKYTFWYTSGDDNPGDNNFDGFLAYDIDITDSIGLMEGGYADDTAFTERHYIYDKGFIMNRLGVDYKATDKLKLGLAGMYMLISEDFEYVDDSGTSRSNNELGFELDSYFTYMLYENLELSANVGYLLAGDAMDVFETKRDGKSDEDIFISSARIRFKF